jgi:hypothetical protein
VGPRITKYQSDRKLNFPPKFIASLAEKMGRREMKKLNYKKLTDVTVLSRCHSP